MSVPKDLTNLDMSKTCVNSTWTQVLCPHVPIDGDVEIEWLEQALGGISTAALWIGKQGLVAPMSYQRHENLIGSCAASASRGWPVRFRRSGGGVVPQGPGILNLSLARPCDRPPGDLAESIYADLCLVLTQALAAIGINATTRPVSGSFCDGRFNLAVTSVKDEVSRKIAGTAQYWRHAGSRHAVLAHALLIVDADPLALVEETNRFETALASGRQYDCDALTSVSRAWRDVHPGRAPQTELLTELRQSIISALNQLSPAGDF
jgi:hypothetical protein